MLFQISTNFAAIDRARFVFAQLQARHFSFQHVCLGCRLLSHQLLHDAILRPIQRAQRNDVIVSFAASKYPWNQWNQAKPYFIDEMRSLNYLSFIHSQFIVKVFSVKYSEEITWMINTMHDVYKVNVKTSVFRRKALFDRFAFYTEIVFKCGTILYGLSVLSYFAYPLYMYLMEKKIVTVMPTYIPGIDEDSVGGFVITTGYHIIVLAFGMIAASACDFLFMMIIVNIPVMAELIKMEVQQLNEILTSEKVDMSLMRYKLRNILLMHREMTE